MYLLVTAVDMLHSGMSRVGIHYYAGRICMVPARFPMASCICWQWFALKGGAAAHLIHYYVS